MARNGNTQIFLTQIICTVKTYHIIVFKTFETITNCSVFELLFLMFLYFSSIKSNYVWQSHHILAAKLSNRKSVIAFNINHLVNWIKVKVVQKYSDTDRIKFCTKNIVDLRRIMKYIIFLQIFLEQTIYKSMSIKP